MFRSRLNKSHANILMKTQLLSLGLFGLALTLLGAGCAPETTPTGPDFNTLAVERFAQLEASWKEGGDELETIECPNGNCRSVVYFRFNELPVDPDMETVIRGNAATYSKFKLDETGTSHVTVIGTINGNLMFQCYASKGMFTDCK